MDNRNNATEIDYEYEISNGWDRLGTMVLRELQRLGRGQDDILSDLKSVKGNLQGLELWRARVEGGDAANIKIKRGKTDRTLIFATLIAGVIGGTATIIGLALTGTGHG